MARSCPLRVSTCLPLPCYMLFLSHFVPLQPCAGQRACGHWSTWPSHFGLHASEVNDSKKCRCCCLAIYIYSNHCLVTLTAACAGSPDGMAARRSCRSYTRTIVRRRWNSGVAMLGLLSASQWLPVLLCTASRQLALSAPRVG